jgi:uncharacterized protein (DUF362 family)
MSTERDKRADERGKIKGGVNRRDFILYSAAAGAGLVAAGAGLKKLTGLPAASSAYAQKMMRAAKDKSRVVVVRSDDLFDYAQEPSREKTEWMLSAGMGSLFGVENTADGWKNLFKPDDVVGIKVNCIAGPEMSTHPLVVAAIVSELRRIPIPAENIIIWDRTNRELSRAGYNVNVNGPGVRCYGTNVTGYEKAATVKGSFDGRLSKILTQRITALINVPILKNHGGAGVTISMKNHYGSFHNPGRHHGKMCDPYIADLNSVDEIKAKTRLFVCDATKAQCNGGPGYKSAFAWQYSGLIVSTDPVALDTVGTQIIDERRTEIGLPRLAEAGRHPRQLASAAERGLGNTEMNRIDLRTLTV